MSIKKKSIVLLQGVFEPALFDQLKKKRVKEVFVLEGRPTLEAAKDSSRQLLQRGIRATLIADNMAGFLFYKGLVKEVWLAYQFADKTGALCQIGGLILGVLASAHKIPAYVSPGARTLPILGDPKEILFFNGIKVAPAGVPGYVPLVEWVPKKYIGKTYGK